MTGERNISASLQKLVTAAALASLALVGCFSLLLCSLTSGSDSTLADGTFDAEPWAWGGLTAACFGSCAAIALRAWPPIPPRSSVRAILGHALLVGSPVLAVLQLERALLGSPYTVAGLVVPDPIAVVLAFLLILAVPIVLIANARRSKAPPSDSPTS